MACFQSSVMYYSLDVEGSSWEETLVQQESIVIHSVIFLPIGELVSILSSQTISVVLW
jgi:hypothetical protein